MSMSDSLEALYNGGERLVPGVRNDRDETVRHKSSYLFFRRIVERDLVDDPGSLASRLRILDIGCGVGHGSRMLAEILHSEVIGIDPSEEAIAYAQKHYHADNLTFLKVDTEQFLSSAPDFDYVVSRHALEHAEGGIGMALRARYRRRLMVNVPFDESEGNVYHRVHRIREGHFDAYPNREFFYEGLDGVTTDARSEASPPNSIICIASQPQMPSAARLLQFPFAAWQPEYLQDLGLQAMERADSLEARSRALDARETLVVSREAKLAASDEALGARDASLAAREEALAASEARYGGLLVVRVGRRLRRLRGA